RNLRLRIGLAVGGVCLLGSCTRALGADTPPPTIVPVAADAYVNTASPAAIYGGATRLRVDGSPLMSAYLRFDVPSLSAPVAKATLRLFATTGLAAGVSLYGVAPGWDEATISASTAPPLAPPAVGSS